MARRFQAVARVTYLGGTLVAGDRAALAHALGRTCAVTVSAEVLDVVTVTTSVESANALDALTVLDRMLDNALYYIGLIEHFDISGKSLSVHPSL